MAKQSVKISGIEFYSIVLFAKHLESANGKWLKKAIQLINFN